MALPQISSEHRQALARILRSVTADLLATQLQLRQLHWNVQGPNFITLHELFDTLSNAAKDAADEVAERALALGFPVVAEPASIASGQSLAKLPEGFLTDRRALSAALEIVSALTAAMRGHLPAAADADPVTEDLLIGTLAGFEKHQWMLRALAAEHPESPRA